MSISILNKKNDSSKNLAKEIKDLKLYVKKLEGEIEILKICSGSKEIQLNKMTVEKEKSEKNLLAKIRDQRETIVEMTTMGVPDFWGNQV